MLAPWPADTPVAGPLIAVGSVLVGSLGIPVPTLAALVFAGSLVARTDGGLELAAVTALVATGAALVGDFIWFFVGRRYGARILALLCRLSLSRDSCVRRAADLFVRRGVRILLFVRFLPGLALMSAPLAGASGIALGSFVIYDAAGAVLWICSGLLLGYLAADQVGAVMLALERFGFGLGGAAAAVVLAYVGFQWVRRRQLLHRLRMARISAEELDALVAGGAAPLIIDVRSQIERDGDPFLIPGARVLGDVERELSSLPSSWKIATTRPVVIYCSCPNEVSAASVAKRLRGLGFADVHPLLGGIDGWRAAGFPLDAVGAPVRRATSG